MTPISAALSVVMAFAILAVTTPSARAAIAHKFLPALSAKLSEGVPKGCGVEPPESEPPCVSGASGGPNGVTVAAGKLWLTDSVGGHARVDAFDPVTGAFLPPQLDETESTGLIVGAPGMAEAFGMKLAYVHVTAGVAVYDTATGQLVGTWTGAHTENGGFNTEASGLLNSPVAADESESLSDSARGDVYVVTVGDHEPLTGLTGELMGMIVLPYLGPAAARREQHLADLTPLSAVRREPSESPSGRGDPLRDVPMRLTYRTALALKSVAQNPGASNRVVGEHAGVHDQGQVSKLLARLQRIGLLQNTGEGHTKGAANAWRLADLGERVTRQLSLGARHQKDAA